MSLRFRALIVLLVLAAASAAAASQPKRSVWESRQIHPKTLGDGVYTIPNRSVVCRVRGEAAACMTHWVVIICREYCRPKKEGDLSPSEQIVKWDDLRAPNVRLLKPHVYVNLAELTCDVGRNYVDCNLSDGLGGFQLGDTFARNLNWDETPSRNWPWNGRHYKPRDAPFHQVDAPP